jgi:hypothetical protein
MEYTVSDTSNYISLKEMVNNDQVRYQKKGYGIVIAVLLTIAFFAGAPEFYKIIWPKMAELSIAQKYFFLMIPSHVAVYVIVNAIMWVIYKMKVPFFEQYKVTT